MKFRSDTAIFLAARSGSKRLPNKHFLKLNSNYTVIDFCINRLKKSKITKEILHFAYNKKELGYYELKEQICQGVIEKNDNFWNENILGRYFSTDLTKK